MERKREKKMKIIDGVVYYSKAETAELLGKSTQTLVIWDKRSDKEEADGGVRYIPKPLRLFKLGERYWKREDIEDMREFFERIGHRSGQTKYGRRKPK